MFSKISKKLKIDTKNTQNKKIKILKNTCEEALNDKSPVNKLQLELNNGHNDIFKH